MDKTLEVRFLDRDNVLSDVRYYYCSYVVHVVHVSLMMFVHEVLYIYSVCVHASYVMLCIGC